MRAGLQSGRPRYQRIRGKSGDGLVQVLLRSIESSSCCDGLSLASSVLEWFNYSVFTDS